MCKSQQPREQYQEPVSGPWYAGIARLQVPGCGDLVPLPRPGEGKAGYAAPALPCPTGPGKAERPALHMHGGTSSSPILQEGLPRGPETSPPAEVAPLQGRPCLSPWCCPWPVGPWLPGLCGFVRDKLTLFCSQSLGRTLRVPSAQHPGSGTLPLLLLCFSHFHCQTPHCSITRAQQQKAKATLACHEPSRCI